MRPSVLVVLLLCLPAASAWDDDAGDQRLGRATHFADGEPQYQWIDAEHTSWYQNADLLSGTIEERAAELVFTIRVPTTQATGPPPVPGLPAFEEFVHGFGFRIGQEEYAVGFTEGFFTDGEPMISLLYRYDIFGQERYFPTTWAAPAQAIDGGGWTGAVPKEVLRDQHMVPIREGSRLEDVRMFAANNDFSFGGFSDFCIDVPSQPRPPSFGVCSWVLRDEAEGLGDVEIQVTPPGVGHLFLRIPQPFRLSNGLATTYLFDAELRNLEAFKDVVNLQVSDVPPGWEVRLPTHVQFDGQGSQSVPVAVTVPFSHVHGQSHFMRLTAVSASNASAVVESMFGVIYADPPQPAGHHDTLYFHAEDYCGGSFGGCISAYMNAAPDYERSGGQAQRVDAAPAQPSYFTLNEPDQMTEPAVYGWDIWLEPSLGIGLDFDTTKKGTLSATLRFDEAWTGDVDATLVLHSYQDDVATVTTLATGGLEGVNLPAGQEVGLDIELTPTPESDLVHVKQWQSLVLYLNVTDTSGLPGWMRYGEAHLLVDESQMRLPLLDYHEPVDLSGLAFANLRIERLNQTLKYVNPGETTLFVFNVTNLGTRQATLDWEIAGASKFTAWATVRPATTHLAPGGNGTVVVRVVPPAGSVEGDVAELLLVGTMRQDPSTKLFGRLIAAVDTQEDIADEAAAADRLEGQAKQANEANRKQSPLPPGLAVAALAAILLLRRRSWGSR